MPYNQIRPRNDDDEMKDDSLSKDGDLKKTNTGSMLALFVGCAVLIVYPIINHPELHNTLNSSL